MTRSGYSDCLDDWALIRWRGAVNSAIRGRRGQSFLREMVEALEAMPEKRLERSVLVSDEGCCAMGAVALHRGVDVSGVDPYDRDEVAKAMGITAALAAEVADANDGDFCVRQFTPEQRWQYMHRWATERLQHDKGGESDAGK